MHNLNRRRSSLEEIVLAHNPAASRATQPDASIPTERLLTTLGGVERFARLKTLYDKARPRRNRWGPGILTSEEAFRADARKNGYSDDGVAMFIDQLD